MTEPVSETLNPSNAALLLIDHQVGTMNFGITDLSAMELKNQTLLLAESARAFGLPVFLTASNATMLISELLADWSSKYAEPIGKILGARVPNFGFVAASFYHRPAK
jgi:hypothetical protein